MRAVQLLYALVPLLAACAALAPPTGWVKKDAATQTGTFVFRDGSRYEGSFQGDTIHGLGTLVYDYPKGAKTGYANTADAPQLEGGRLTVTFNNNTPQPGKARFVSGTRYWAGHMDPFTYEGGYDGGFKGPGVVTFADGRRYEGVFSNSSVPYHHFDKDMQSRWRESRLIGSHFAGDGRMSWPDGTVFVGHAYPYYLFDRGFEQTVCTDARFFGAGLLIRPGQADYRGLVGEKVAQRVRTVQPVTRAELDEYVADVAGCLPELSARRRGDQRAMAEYNAKVAEGKRMAQAMLARDLSNLSARIGSDMARVEAASRGSSVEEDQARARRDAEFHARIAQQQSDPNSQLNREKREREARLAEARQADSDRAAERAADTRRRQDERVASQAADERDRQRSDAAAAKRQAEEEQAQQARQRERIENEKRAQALLDELARKREAAAEAERQKAEAARLAREEEQSRTDYLAAMQRGIKLYSRSCFSKTEHSIVGTKPTIRPQVVGCVSVHYEAICPGAQRGVTGVIERFVGASTDCFMSDVAKASPTPACAPGEARVVVTQVTSC